MTDIKGLELCERFFHDVCERIINDHFPELRYSAGLIGYGSDVLGYDDEVSRDHMWGPRFYMFLRDCDIKLKPVIFDVLSRELPYEFMGYSVNFTEPDPEDNGVQHAKFISAGPVRPLIFIYTINGFLDEYLGAHELDSLKEVDWLAFSEHRLLAMTAGKLFRDDLNIESIRNQLTYYPQNVQLYLIASCWSLIAEEQAFVRRCADVGDELGSRLITGRLIERLMRLAFLYCKKYAPYSKWFGTAFSRLAIDKEFKTALDRAILTADIIEREEALILAQKLMTELHNTSGLTEPVEVSAGNYFSRKIKVIHAERLAEVTLKELKGTSLENVPLIGSLSQVSNLMLIADEPCEASRIQRLYEC